jgi:hypothetical protein
MIAVILSRGMPDENSTAMTELVRLGRRDDVRAVLEG